MYNEYLGENYHDIIRKILTADDTLCPDSIIDAPLNIGAMQMLTKQALERMMRHGKRVDNEQMFNQLQTAAQYYLAGVLCSAIQSRVKVPPFVKYARKNWKKKQKKCMEKGWQAMRVLMQMG